MVSVAFQLKVNWCSFIAWAITQLAADGLHLWLSVLGGWPWPWGETHGLSFILMSMELTWYPNIITRFPDWKVIQAHYVNLTKERHCSLTLADPRAAPGIPPGVQILSFSCSFRQKYLKNNSTFGSWRTPPPGKILDPPLLEVLWF